MTDQELKEYMAKVAQLPEARKNSDKGYAGFRGSRSVFPTSPDVQTMVMFVEPKVSSPDSVSARNALLIVGVNNGVTEAQQHYVLVKTVNGVLLDFAYGAPVIVDEVPPAPSAVTFEQVRLNFREGKILEMEGEEASGLKIQATQNAIAMDRFRVDLRFWTLRQLKDGGGPMVIPGGGVK